eukprot:166574-Karenia_brevis.AAC.1
MAVASSIKSVREFAPLRKAGPRIVRSVENLRPISISTDLVQVQDGLWVQRNMRHFEQYCGPCQVDGVSDAISLLLAVVLQVQIRSFQGLDSYLAFGDQKLSCDVADHTTMK